MSKKEPDCTIDLARTTLWLQQQREAARGGGGGGGDAHSGGCDNDETVGSGCRAGYQGARDEGVAAADARVALQLGWSGGIERGRQELREKEVGARVAAGAPLRGRGGA